MRHGGGSAGISAQGQSSGAMPGKSSEFNGYQAGAALMSQFKTGPQRAARAMPSSRYAALPPSVAVAVKANSHFSIEAWGSGLAVISDQAFSRRRLEEPTYPADFPISPFPCVDRARCQSDRACRVRWGPRRRPIGKAGCRLTRRARRPPARAGRRPIQPGPGPAFDALH